MVLGMPGGENSAQCCAIYSELLAVLDIPLALVGLVFVNYCPRREFQQLLNASYMVMMPMRNKSFGNRGILLLQRLLQRRNPGRFPLPRINQQPPLPSADDVGISACIACRGLDIERSSRFRGRDCVSLPWRVNYKAQVLAGRSIYVCYLLHNRWVSAYLARVSCQNADYSRAQSFHFS